MLKVERNIPMPKRASRNAVKYPFLEMKVGDSFFIADPKLRSGIYTSAAYRKMRCATRKEKSGLRVWRVK